jgi:STE24 endopeptidase
VFSFFNVSEFMLFSRVIAVAILLSPAIGNAQESPFPTPLPSAIVNAPDPASATQAWLATIPPAEKARSDAYFEGGYWLILWNFLVSAAIMLLLLSTRTSARIRDFTERITRSKALQLIVYIVGFTIIVAALTFPLECYQNFVREHQYGMATQNFTAWFSDWLKMLVVQLIALPLPLVALYAVFRRTPNLWWIIGTIIAMLFFVLGTVIAPVYIEPLFNKYTPLQDPKIRDPILQLARANEIPVTKVFVVDASRQTKRVSANVSGFLNTTRIALNDNLLKQCTLPEIREVMAHEMGHYVLNHIVKFFAFVALLTLLMFGLAKLGFEWAVRRWGEAWGVRNIGDPAGWPLLVLIFAVLGFLGTPVNNTLVRTQEREADAFALNAAREPDASAEVALKLGVYRKMEPAPLEEFLFFDHPSGRSRIRMAMDWKYASLPESARSENR